MRGVPVIEGNRPRSNSRKRRIRSGQQCFSGNIRNNRRRCRRERKRRASPCLLGHNARAPGRVWGCSLARRFNEFARTCGRCWDSDIGPNLQGLTAIHYVDLTRGIGGFVGREMNCQRGGLPGRSSLPIGWRAMNSARASPRRAATRSAAQAMGTALWQGKSRCTGSFVV